MRSPWPRPTSGKLAPGDAPGLGRPPGDAPGLGRPSGLAYRGAARRSSCPLPLLLGLLALALCACRNLPPATSTSSPAIAVIAAAAQATPTLRFGPIQEYRGDELYNFMNGAAVTYLEHHCRALAAGDVFRGADQAKIELYEMASPDDARRLYAQLTASPGTAFPAGAAGCTWAGFEPEALFRRERFLVRLLGYAQDRSAAASLLVEVATALEAQLRQR